MEKGKRKVLGKGLNALFPEIGSSVLENTTSEPSVTYCAVKAITPNPHQPRKTFDDEKIEELAASMRTNGIIQPLLVRRGFDGYELIAGERRWRAALKAGLAEVPVVVRDVSNEQALVLSLIENIQREDLNPIEEAKAFQRLTDEFSLSQETVADIVGKERSTVTNMLRLLKLPERIKEDLAAGKISSGHARALLALETVPKMLKLHQEIVARQLSVREAERLSRKMKPGKGKPVAPVRREDIELTSLKERLQYLLGTQVKIVRKGKRGRVEISFFSDQDLERILEIAQRGSKSYDERIKQQ